MKSLNRVLYGLCISFFLFFQAEGGAAQEISEIRGEDAGQEDYSDFHSPYNVRVILEREYLDGEISEEIIEDSFWSMDDFFARYAEWQLIDQDDEQVVLHRRIDDISPLLKANGYFGLTKEGILTIFDGKPDESNKVIQSFFQIDVEKLESHQQEQLKKGIPVESKDQYVEVIKTFKSFSSSSQ